MLLSHSQLGRTAVCYGHGNPLTMDSKLAFSVAGFLNNISQRVEQREFNPGARLM